jgi:hypothetical protein
MRCLGCAFDGGMYFHLAVSSVSPYKAKDSFPLQRKIPARPDPC